MKKAVFLDRDGTLNRMVYNPDYGLVDSPASPDDFILLPGVAESIRAINRNGLLAVVVSNQPGVAKGKIKQAVLDEITQKMNSELKQEGARLDGVYYCLHHPDSVFEEYRLHCECRKPKPGLLMQAAQELDIDLAHSYMIGDGITDIIAGDEVGCTTVLVGPRKCYICHELAQQNTVPDYVVSDLSEAVDMILAVEQGLAPLTFDSMRGGLRDHLSLAPDMKNAETYTNQYLIETSRVIERLDQGSIEQLVNQLVELRERGGRLFLLGVGGSAANCSHAVNDFRKLVHIEAYAPTDNVSELTARTNDEGWSSVFVEWLKISRLQSKDMIFILSVGGGSLEKNISPNLVAALKYAKEVSAGIVGVVGRDGGYTAQVADVCVIIPTVNPDSVTPHAESFQAMIWHLLVSHPALKAAAGKWESSV
jgi:D-sedoheptulose 7-phosphate isomerase